MFKWKEQNGKIIANRAFVMTEAWIIYKRCKSVGIERTFAEAMKLAWGKANDEVRVQIQVQGHMLHIKKLAALGRDALSAMADNIENIDRHNAAHRNQLADIRSAMHYA